MASIVGVGISDLLWKQLVAGFKKRFGNTITYEHIPFANLDTDHFFAIYEHLSFLKPVAVFIDARTLSVMDEHQYFVSVLQERLKEHPCLFSLVLKRHKSELNALIGQGCQLELFNQMKLHVDTEEILLNTSLSKFPRIRIDRYMDSIVYEEESPHLAESTLQKLTPGTLIPLKKLHGVVGSGKKMTAKSWLKSFLEEQPPTVPVDQIKGILKEEKGCYLFPGIPIDRVKHWKAPKFELNAVIQKSQLSMNSMAYKHLIRSIKQRSQSASVSTETPMLGDAIPVCLLGGRPVINSILKRAFREKRVQYVHPTQKPKPGHHKLNDQCIWLQLTRMKHITFEGNYWNETSSIKPILDPLRYFIKLSDLEFDSQKSYEALSIERFRKYQDKLIRKEKQCQIALTRYKSQHVLLTQEFPFVQEAEVIAKRLIPCLAHHVFVDEASLPQVSQNLEQALILVEDQGIASSVSYELAHVSKKLWVNPEDIADYEQLPKLNIEAFEAYADQGILVVTAPALEMLENLVSHALERAEQIDVEVQQCENALKRHQRELDRIQHQKQELALRWLYGSLQKWVSERQQRLNPSTYAVS